MSTFRYLHQDWTREYSPKILTLLLRISVFTKPLFVIVNVSEKCKTLYIHWRDNCLSCKCINGNFYCGYSHVLIKMSCFCRFNFLSVNLLNNVSNKISGQIMLRMSIKLIRSSRWLYWNRMNEIS